MLKSILGAPAIAALSLSLLGACATVEPSEPIASVEQTTTSPVVTTQYGQVQGVVKDGVNVFLGIPYGADTRNRRFKRAEPPANWDGVLQATSYPDTIPQLGMSSAMFASWAPDPEPEMSEDVLGLNIWTPGTDDRKRPVMVWLHGGGFIAGNGSSKVYDGTRNANRGDVVTVTINHRLNAFGYLYLEQLGGADYADSGNVGNLDMILALKWVKENIAAFGGNPDNVTIFGESGGGRKVSTLLAMPEAEGLFSKAIVQSGSHLKVRTPAEATQDTRAYLTALGVSEDNLAALNDLPQQAFIDALNKVGTEMSTPVQFGPVLDGRNIPQHPFDGRAATSARNVTLMVGYNDDELSLWLAPDPRTHGIDYDQVTKFLTPYVKAEDTQALVDGYRKIYPNESPEQLLYTIASDARYGANAVRQARLKVQQGGAPVWLYHFEYETSVFDGKLGTPHALELAFTFDNLAVSESMAGPAEPAQPVADQLSEAWIAFARHGDPNARGLPYWPRVTADRPTAMRLNMVSKPDPDFFAKEQAVWDSLPSRQSGR